MLKISINEIIIATKGRKILLSSPNNIVNYISTSSKDITPDSLFIPIIGEVKDGHNYMIDAYNNGCRNFLIDENHQFSKPDVNLISVKNTTKALGDLAKFYKEKFSIPYIGITGSVGKTSTKDIVYSVVKEAYQTLKNEGNFNNEIGLPKTIFNLNQGHEVAILEMGMSYKDEIKHLANIVRPNIAIISNIGMSHIENFSNQEGIFNAKMEITTYFDENSTLIVNGDDDYLKSLKNKNFKYQILSYGFNNNNDIICTNYEIKKDKINFKAIYQDEIFNITIPSNAKHNIYNSMAAILVGKLLNISNEKIIKGLSNFAISKGRLTIIKKRDLTIIDDSYNASCDSMISALNVLKLYPNRKVAVLGDILETGSYNEVLHRKVGNNIKNNVDFLITVGNFSKYISDEAIKQGLNKEQTISFSNYEELIKNIDKILLKNDTILLKASHGIHLDKVVEYLDKNYEA